MISFVFNLAVVALESEIIVAAFLGADEGEEVLGVSFAVLPGKDNLLRVGDHAKMV